MKADRYFQRGLNCAALILLVLVGGIALTLFGEAFLSIKTFGLPFWTGNTWDPVREEFGSLPFLVGTLCTSFLALLISIPFSLAVALFLGEFCKRGPFSGVFKSLIELLAGIPSIIYGFWGLLVLVPWIRALEIKLGVIPYGVGILTSALILAVMIIPYSSSIAREMISMVPNDLREAAYALGATRTEVILKTVLPFARSGIFAGFMLSLGRALGETMAVTMVIGNRNAIPTSIFSPGNTMASVIANEFAEATTDIYLSALVEIGLILFLVTTVINLLGKWITKKISIEVST